jgi:hypothetical protein
MKKLLLVLLISFAAQAQKAAEVKLDQIADRRSSGSFASLTLSLEMPSVMSSTVAASRVLVTAATDDAGNDLLPADDREVQFAENMRSAMLPKGAGDAPVTVSLELKNPARTAKLLREAKGEIELLMPSKDPNSVAELTKYLPGSGKPISNKALKANGVELTFLTAAQLEAENAKREYGKIELQESDVAVRLKDPNKRIHDVRYIDAAGEAKRVSTSDYEGITVISTWSGKPQADWKLRILMKSPKNVVKYPFALKDVPLP